MLLVNQRMTDAWTMLPSAAALGSERISMSDGELSNVAGQPDLPPAWSPASHRSWRSGLPAGAGITKP